MKQLFLIFTVCFALTEQKPEVTTLPGLEQGIFSGDTLVLRCSGSGKISWFFNGTEKTSETQNETWIISAVSTNNSGSYKCQTGEGNSEPKHVEVLGYFPPAILSLKSGQPVITKGDSVVLELQVDEGLLGWQCRVYKGGRVRRIVIKKSLMLQNLTQVQIHPNTLRDDETMAIYWCEHKTEIKRSNSITIRTTGKMVMLETLPGPAILGKQLILECLVWGKPKISNAVFYKDEKKVGNASSTYTISKMEVSDMGRYKCTATYKFKKNTSNITNTVTSDPQELSAIESPPWAELKVNEKSMSCSCPKCSGSPSYRFYYKGTDDKMRIINNSSPTADKTGSYLCRAIIGMGASMLSDPIDIEVKNGNSHTLYIVLILIALLILGVVLVVLIIRRRRNAANVQEPAGYEVLPLGQEMNKNKEGGQGGDGGYEALKRSKTDEKEAVYHTLGAEGGKGGEGGYEALQRSKIDEKEGEYQTLGSGGETGVEGGYQALKRSKTDEKDGEYQTLGAEGGKGGDGGYEALKRSKTDEKDGEYQTLGAGGGKGGEKEALKKKENE